MRRTKQHTPDPDSEYPVKNPAILVATALTSLFLLHTASAADLTLIVLKKGGITETSFTEVSRTIAYLGSKYEGKDVSVWKKVPAGMLCMKTHLAESYTSPSCSAALKVVSNFSINGFRYVVKNEAEVKRITDRGEDLLNAEEINELIATNFAPTNSSLLDIVYDVQNGTEFRDGHRMYVKNLRLYVDTATKQIMKMDTSAEYLPWPHGGWPTPVPRQ